MDAAPNPAPHGEPFWPRVVVILLILAGIVLTAFFGTRVLRGVMELHQMRLHPRATDVSLIRPWMTLPYISRAYRVPEELLWQGLNIPPDNNRHKSLRILEREYSPNQPDALLKKVQAIIHDFQAQNTPTPNALPRSYPRTRPDPGKTAL